MSLEGETTHGIDGFQPLDDLISPTYIGEHPIFEIFFTPSTLICRKERLPLSRNALYSLLTHPQHFQLIFLLIRQTLSAWRKQFALYPV